MTESLPASVLARAKTLPLKPDPIKLPGRFVRLAPLDVERDAGELYEVVNGQSIDLAGRVYPAYDADDLIWRHLFQAPPTDLASFRAYLADQVNGADRLCLCVIEQESNRPVGVANLMSNVPSFLRIELGGIWYSPVIQRTQVNL